MPTPFVGSSEAQGSGLSLSDTGDHTRPLANRLALAREVSSNDGTLFILLRHRAYRGLHRFRSRCRIGCADPNATCGRDCTYHVCDRCGSSAPIFRDWPSGGCVDGSAGRHVHSRYDSPFWRAPLAGSAPRPGLRTFLCPQGGEHGIDVVVRIGEAADCVDSALVQTNPALYNASSLPQARSASDLL